MPKNWGSPALPPQHSSLITEGYFFVVVVFFHSPLRRANEIFLASREQLASVTRRGSRGRFFTTLMGWTHFCHYSTTEHFLLFSSLASALSGWIDVSVSEIQRRLQKSSRAFVLPALSSLTGG